MDKELIEVLKRIAIALERISDDLGDLRELAEEVNKSKKK